jgi:glycosyltransferase involved in cell wall biosynthesis
MDTPLHNEVINEGANGWLISCTTEEMKDNTDGLTKSAIFEISDMREKILHLARNTDEVNKIIRQTRKNYDARFSVKSISKLFYDSLCDQLS